MYLFPKLLRRKKKVLRFKTLMSFPIHFHTVGKAWDLWSPLLKVFPSIPTPCSSCCQCVAWTASPACPNLLYIKGRFQNHMWLMSCIKYNQILTSSAGPLNPFDRQCWPNFFRQRCCIFPLKASHETCDKRNALSSEKAGLKNKAHSWKHEIAFLPNMTPAFLFNFVSQCSPFSP